MKRFKRRLIVVMELMLLFVLSALPPASAQTGFPYRGKLSTAVTGSYDFRFTLYNASSGGTAVGTPLLRTRVAVTGGNYTVTLDFGSDSFAAAPLYIQVAYRKSGTAAFANTGSRLLLTVRFSVTAASAMGLQGRPVSPDAPVAGQVLKFDGAQWTPGTDEGGGGGGLTLPYAGSASTTDPAFAITNTGGGIGVLASSISAAGVYGRSQDSAGVVGQSDSFTGVYGYSPSHFGVWGISTNNTGVAGTSTNWIGVNGYSPNFVGVWGQSDNSAGVHGVSYNWVGTEGWSTNSTGVWGDSINWLGVYGSSVSGHGVWGYSKQGAGVVGKSDAWYGTYGESNGGYAGVFGTGTKNGVFGLTNSNGDSGVFGLNTGNGWGVYGSNSKAGGYGFLGGYDPDNGYPVGVFGYGGDKGGYFKTARFGSYGVYGYGGIRGVYGFCPGTGDGVLGITAGGPGSKAVEGYSRDGTGVYGNSLTYYAGEFNGILTATDKRFQIDHPLDPANKTLNHACVESSERLNVYSGNITTNARGDAAVLLPEWFEALNGDFRYQLTVIGQFAQAVVATEIAHGRFTLKTDKPFVKVSWQVTGVRKDAYAKAHPMEVEQVKPDNERGTYLHPKEHGMSESLGRDYAREQRKQQRQPAQRR